MRTLELKDNDLFLDGKRLEYLTEFNIEYEAETPTDRHWCRLIAKGLASKDGKLLVDDNKDYVHYLIDENVKLAGAGGHEKGLYQFKEKKPIEVKANIEFDNLDEYKELTDELIEIFGQLKSKVDEINNFTLTGSVDIK